MDHSVLELLSFRRQSLKDIKSQGGGNVALESLFRDGNKTSPSWRRRKEGREKIANVGNVEACVCVLSSTTN